MERDNEGLIIPKKLINPCLDSKERKDLHRELLFNQKIGKNVLNQKTELEKVLQERKQKERMNEINRKEQEMTGDCRTFENELQKKIAKRKDQSENPASSGASRNEDESELNEEYLRIRSGLRHNNEI